MIDFGNTLQEAFFSVKAFHRVDHERNVILNRDHYYRSENEQLHHKIQTGKENYEQMNCQQLKNKFRHLKSFELI